MKNDTPTILNNNNGLTDRVDSHNTKTEKSCRTRDHLCQLQQWLTLVPSLLYSSSPAYAFVINMPLEGSPDSASEWARLHRQGSVSFSDPLPALCPKIFIDYADREMFHSWLLIIWRQTSQRGTNRGEDNLALMVAAALVAGVR